MKEAFVRQYVQSFGAGSLGTVLFLTGFQVPLGVYKVEVYAQGAGLITITADQPSLYYQATASPGNPEVVNVLSPDQSGVISFHATCNTNVATTESGVIILTPLTLV